MLMRFLKIAVPSVVSTVIMFTQHFVAIMLAGHMQNPVLIDSVGMGNLIQNCFFVTPIWGMNSALETLVSQSAGAKDYKLSGMYLNTGRIVLLIMFVIQIVIALNTQNILIFLH